MDKATYDQLSAMGYREIFRACREDPTLDSGSPDVQFLLALCVRDGRGVRKDPKTFQKVLEWCMEKGSLLAIGYRAGYEKGRLEAEQKKETQDAREDSVPFHEKGRPEAERKKEETPVTVLFLTRPTVPKRVNADSSEPAKGMPDRGDIRAGNERTFEQAPADGAERIRRILDAGNDSGIRELWESGEFERLLGGMDESKRKEVLAELFLLLRQYQQKGLQEMLDISRKMIVRILEGKVYVSDLQLTTKNENGEEETLPILWFAVWLGDEVLARYLLQNGANPNLVRFCRLAGGVALNRYVLGECILQANLPMARLLLDNGANVRKMDGKKGADGSESLTSPLAYAVLRNSAECVCLLLEKGINPNEGYHYRDKEGKWHLQSALYLAVQHTKNLEIARLLLAGGANPDTAGSLTNVQGEMLRLLLKYPRQSY